MTNYSTFPSSTVYYATIDMCETRKNVKLNICYVRIFVKETRYNKEYMNILEYVNSCKWNSLPYVIFFRGSIVCRIIYSNKSMTNEFLKNGYSEHINVKKP